MPTNQRHGHPRDQRLLSNHLCVELREQLAGENNCADSVTQARYPAEGFLKDRGHMLPLSGLDNPGLLVEAVEQL